METSISLWAVRLTLGYTSTGIGNGIAKELDLFRLGPGLARNAKLGHWSRSSDLAKKISTVCGRHMHMGRRLRTLCWFP